MKKILIYLNNECFIDTDLTVLRELSKHYHVIWIPVIQRANPPYNREFIQEYASKYQIEVHVFEYDWRMRSLKNMSFYFAIVQLINKKHCDILFTANNNIYWVLISQLFLKPLLKINGLHDVVCHSGFKSVGLLSLSTKISIMLNKNFIFYSKNQKKLFDTLYCRNTYMVGMSYKDFGNSSLKVGPVSQGVKLLFFGRIDIYKGLDRLIIQLENLHQIGVHNIQLTIAGKGDFWKQCNTFIKTPNMYNLQIRFVDNEEIPDLMSSHHFLILPYHDATQSGPLMIAVRYGLPIIAPAFGCFADIYSHGEGILYGRGELEKALIRVSKLTDYDYDNMRDACLKYREQYDEKRIIQNYIKFIDGLFLQE